MSNLIRKFKFPKHNKTCQNIKNRLMHTRIFLNNDTKVGIQMMSDVTKKCFIYCNKIKINQLIVWLVLIIIPTEYTADYLFIYTIILSVILKIFSVTLYIINFIINLSCRFPESACNQKCKH